MGKKGRISKKEMLDIPPENINPVDFETRFGALVPWGGAMFVGGAAVPLEEDSEGDENDEGND